MIGQGNVTKGSLSVTGADGAVQSLIFQYNPVDVKRTVQPNIVGGEKGQHSAAIRFGMAPEETIVMTVEIDALDQLPTPSQTKAAPSIGIYPALNALELTMYPTLKQVQQNQSKLSMGMLQVPPFDVPQVLLSWGKNRVVPVVVQSYEVTEQLYDKALNPIRATIDLTLRAVTYSDVQSSNAAYNQFVTYQQFKEQSAKKV